MGSTDAKLKEALEHMQKAEKALKTNWMKWNPDNDTAASEYTKAATCFKLAKSIEKAKDAFIKAADMQVRLGSPFHSAKLLVQAAQTVTDVNEAVDLMDRACNLYRENGSLDTAAMTLSKAAKMSETEAPGRSVDMYMKAAELCELDEKQRDAADHLSNAARMELKQSKYLAAYNVMSHRLDLMISVGNASMANTIVIGMVVTCLADDDVTRAELAIERGQKSVLDFILSDECTFCDQFIQSFKEGDQELLTKVKSQPLIKHMDTEIARLARSLTLSEARLAGYAPSQPLPPGMSELDAYEAEDEPISLVPNGQNFANLNLDNCAAQNSLNPLPESSNDSAACRDPVGPNEDDEDDEDDIN